MSFLKRPTIYSPPPTPEPAPTEDPRIAESVKFWTAHGFPQYGGRYDPVMLPQDAKIGSVEETKEGLKVSYQVAVDLGTDAIADISRPAHGSRTFAEIEAEFEGQAEQKTASDKRWERLGYPQYKDYTAPQLTPSDQQIYRIVKRDTGLQIYYIGQNPTQLEQREIERQIAVDDYEAKGQPVPAELQQPIAPPSPTQEVLKQKWGGFEQFAAGLVGAFEASPLTQVIYGAYTSRLSQEYKAPPPSLLLTTSNIPYSLGILGGEALQTLSVVGVFTLAEAGLQSAQAQNVGEYITGKMKTAKLKLSGLMTGTPEEPIMQAGTFRIGKSVLPRTSYDVLGTIDEGYDIMKKSRLPSTSSAILDTSAPSEAIGAWTKRAGAEQGRLAFQEAQKSFLLTGGETLKQTPEGQLLAMRTMAKKVGFDFRPLSEIIAEEKRVPSQVGRYVAVATKTATAMPSLSSILITTPKAALIPSLAASIAPNIVASRVWVVRAQKNQLSNLIMGGATSRLIPKAAEGNVLSMERTALSNAVFATPTLKPSTRTKTTTTLANALGLTNKQAVASQVFSGYASRSRVAIAVFAGQSVSTPVTTSTMLDYVTKQTSRTRQKERKKQTQGLKPLRKRVSGWNLQKYLYPVATIREAAGFTFRRVKHEHTKHKTRKR